MAKSTVGIDKLISSGITQNIAEVVEDITNAYIANPRKFDEGYWISRMERAGGTESMALQVFSAIKKRFF